ncbi:MAG: methionine biosynthesis protein MetW [Marinicellaceae bacterium]
MKLYECCDTGYQFYYPYSLPGGPEFYEELYSSSGNDWGYQEGKWEHKYALSICQSGDALLDVGSGGGDFLKLVSNKVKKACGLETSRFGQETSKIKGVTVFGETVEKHSSKNVSTYDVVT